MGMGYAVEMTAINMVSFYNTIANGGGQKRLSPFTTYLNHNIYKVNRTCSSSVKMQFYDSTYW